ncbi:60S ribosomal protein L18a-like protein [Impatiens glandulifera]|uniref:60S ribosomal protein L18a-like protein n=1 Tax=Impatiens glandulifera TaxID=253017 RepID=UPI001FB17BEF|nr:60S ribosomal protein L18a-like protein [Impatiens glandulifera]
MSEEEEGKDRGFATGSNPPNEQPPSQVYYGTFQGVGNYPPQSTIDFPKPFPPPGTFPPPPPYYDYGVQAFPVITEPFETYAENVDPSPIPGHPVKRRLPCCGIGMGWFLFIVGFFLFGIPWYLGAIFILCSRRIDYREKPGYVSCTIAAVLVTMAIIFGATSHHWNWD